MIEIHKANIKKDVKLLYCLEKAIFPRDYDNLKRKWPQYPETYILFVKKKPVGYVIVQPHRGLYNYKTGKYEIKSGSLHVSATGILPKFRGKGLGDVLKTWTIAYARVGSFKSINATARESNKPIIRLNKKFGFKVTRKIKKFYPDGETALVEELFF